MESTEGQTAIEREAECSPLGEQVGDATRITALAQDVRGAGLRLSPNPPMLSG